MLKALADPCVGRWLTVKPVLTWINGLSGAWEVDNSFTSPPLELILRDQVFTETEELSDYVRKAFQNGVTVGRIHCDILALDPRTGKPEIGYTFASPLHAHYTESMLELYARRSYKNRDYIQEPTVYDFVVNVLKRFSIRRMQRTPRYGYGMVRRSDLPKPQIQDEFSRCCYVHSHGQVRNYAILGTQEGRVDFFIPSKRWAIELLRDGDDVQKHYSFFSTQGCYEWLTQEEISDYIVLDCRYEGENDVQLSRSYPGEQSHLECGEITNTVHRSPLFLPRYFSI